MLGFVGILGQQQAGESSPPSPEMVRDPTFQDAQYWDVGDPPGTSVGLGQAISLDDSGVTPCGSTLLHPTVASTQYSLAVQELTSLSASYQIRLRKSAVAGQQVLLNGTDSFQLRTIDFTADDVYDLIEIRWFEFGITLGLVSLQPVPP